MSRELSGAVDTGQPYASSRRERLRFVTAFPRDVDRSPTASLNVAAGVDVGDGVVVGGAQTDDSETDTGCTAFSPVRRLVVDTRRPGR